MMYLIVSALVVLMTVYYWFFVRNAFDPKSLAGKRVLVTGASSGIGREIARHYARHGASLVIAARRMELLRDVAAECRKLGAAKVEVVQVDLSVTEDRDKLVRETKKCLGGLDHLILNHAIMDSKLWTAGDMPKLELQMSVNFFSYVHIVTGLLDMLTASEGNICVLSSGVGKITTAYSSTYAASKHAVQGFFGCLRQDMVVKKTGVSVTVAVLGLVKTEKAVGILQDCFGDKIMSKMPTPASVEGCAACIVHGTSVRAREIYYPFVTQIGVHIYNVIPAFVDSEALKVFDNQTNG